MARDLHFVPLCSKASSSFPKPLYAPWFVWMVHKSAIVQRTGRDVIHRNNESLSLLFNGILHDIVLASWIFLLSYNHRSHVNESEWRCNKERCLPSCIQNMEIELVSSLFPHPSTCDSLKFIGKQTTLFPIPVQLRQHAGQHEDAVPRISQVVLSR